MEKQRKSLRRLSSRILLATSENTKLPFAILVSWFCLEYCKYIIVSFRYSPCLGSRAFPSNAATKAPSQGDSRTSPNWSRSDALSSGKIGEGTTCRLRWDARRLPWGLGCSRPITGPAGGCCGKAPPVESHGISGEAGLVKRKRSWHNPFLAVPHFLSPIFGISSSFFSPISSNSTSTPSPFPPLCCRALCIRQPSSCELDHSTLFPYTPAASR